MNNVFVIASRELRERSFVFLTAIGIAILPFVISLLPGMQSIGRGEVIGATGIILGVAFALGLAIILGTSVVSRELNEGRLSFYFSKPVSASSIWFGKLTAALLAIVATFTVIGVPAYLFSGERWRAAWSSRPMLFVAALFGVALFLFALSHATTTMVRSRTPLVLLDFALLCTLVGAMWLLVRPLLVALAFQLTLGLAIAIVAALTLVLAIAPAWQLSRGRTDRRRNHFELSRAIWISAAGVLLVAAAYVGWVVSARPSDLNDEFATIQAPAGTWMVLSGEATGRGDYRPTFLLNAANGKEERVPAPYIWHSAFTKDGRALYWMRPDSLHVQRLRGTLAYKRLDDPNAQTVTTSIETSANTYFTMTDDLSRAAVINNRVLTVHDVANDRLLGSVRLPTSAPYPRYAVYFIAPNVVRVIDWSDAPKASNQPKTIRIYELDATRRSFAKTGEATFPTRNMSFTANADGSRLLVRMFPLRRSVIIDARTGATILDVPPETLGGFPQFLSDGSIAAFSPAGDGMRFRVLAPNGTLTTDMKIPGFKRASIAREIAPGKVAATLAMPGSKAVVIDLGRGVIEHSADSLRVFSDVDASADPRTPAVDPSQPILAMDTNGSIVRWNPATGEKVVVVSRSAVAT